MTNMECLRIGLVILLVWLGPLACVVGALGLCGWSLACVVGALGVRGLVALREPDRLIVGLLQREGVLHCSDLRRYASETS